MKWTMAKVMAASLAVAGFAGCSWSNGQPLGTSTHPEQGAGANPGSSFSAALRILGGNNPGYTRVFARISQVSVTGDGHLLALSSGVSDVDLANANQAWLLGTFTVPASTTHLQAKVQFDDFGSFSSPGGNGFIDFRGSPITVDLDIANLAKNGHAVLLMDVAKLLAQTNRADERVAVNHLRLQY